MVKAALVGALAAFAAGCSPFGGASVFTCESDSQCAGGVCQPEKVCSFADSTCASGQRFGEHAGTLSNQCVGDTTLPDAAIDAPSMCTPNAKTCFNHAIETCRGDGMGYDSAQREPCALTCLDGATPSCVAASNIAASDQQMCNANNMAPALAPTAGTVTISADMITCSAGCGNGVMSIARTASTPNNFFCLASISIPSGVTVDYTGAIASGVTLFSAGSVSIEGTITFDGGNAAGTANQQENDDTPGVGGPGGFTGGAAVADDNPGQPGGGPAGTTCGGRGGAITAGQTAQNGAGGGGGGGGNQGTGGIGGDGRTALGGTSAGGAGGTITSCSTADARPLVGGAGGGGGADGAGGPGVQCGWPGGGGGGAIHIVARGTISGAGTISANGGNGYGTATTPGGGGGGGAGGMILLEARSVAFTGTLRANGGTGGTTDRPGGAGAATNMIDGDNGGDANANAQGGAGGGGGGGRIRINAAMDASCAGASPSASCTTGALRTTP